VQPALVMAGELVEFPPTVVAPDDSIIGSDLAWTSPTVIASRGSAMPRPPSGGEC
jgi:hypothetical protein